MPASVFLLWYFISSLSKLVPKDDLGKVSLGALMED